MFNLEPITDFATAFGTTQMMYIAILLAADIILGIAAAIASKKFNFNQLGTFMATGVLPYFFGFAVVEIFASGIGTYGQIATTVVFVVIILNLLGSIISNLANLGVNMPSILKKAI
ncbi:phage holin family protein [Patescibacteria group bacterium]|nr:phage holin family protein [Patescibacteria group bacterium]